MLNKFIYPAVLLSFLTVASSYAVIFSELSKEAQAIVPKASGDIITLKDGTVYKGKLVAETDEKVTLSLKRGQGIAVKKIIAVADIQSRGKVDVSEEFANVLMADNFKLDPKKSFEAAEYRSRIALFTEFMNKCGEAEQYNAVESRCKEHAAELLMVERGMEKVDGTWFTPVRAAIKKFDMYTDGMSKAGRVKRSRNINEKKTFLKESYLDILQYKDSVDPDSLRSITAQIKAKKYDQASDEMVELFRLKRRDAAKSLPSIMQERIPMLLEDKMFDEPVDETTAFLHFWIQQVVKSEGDAKRILGEMDFDYILRMKNTILTAYIDAGMGNESKAGNVTLPRDMVYVPGGYFMMGERGDNPERDTFPMRLVYVSPFLIDKYEVSNEQYRKFVEYVKSSGKADMEHPEAPPLKKHEAEGWKDAALNRPRQPVVGVDYFDAYAYAKWKGKRIPTEAEWEKAARGMDQRKFPWGNEAANIVVNYAAGRKFIGEEMDRQNPRDQIQPEETGGCSCFSKAPEKIPEPEPTRIPVETWDVDSNLPALAVQAKKNGMLEWDKSYPGPYGTYHMAGNAAEWVNDWYEKDYYGISPVRNPQGPEFDSKKRNVNVFRGGSYLSGKLTDLQTFWRINSAHKHYAKGCNTDGRPMIGFRCAKSVGPVEVDNEEGVNPYAATSMAELLDELGIEKPKPKKAVKPKVPAEEKARINTKPAATEKKKPSFLKNSSGLKGRTKIYTDRDKESDRDKRRR